MTLAKTLLDVKFETPLQLLGFLTNHRIVYKLHASTPNTIYTIDPDTKRAKNYIVKETKQKLLYLVEE